MDMFKVRDTRLVLALNGKLMIMYKLRVLWFFFVWDYYEVYNSVDKCWEKATFDNTIAGETEALKVCNMMFSRRVHSMKAAKAYIVVLCMMFMLYVMFSLLLTYHND